MGRNGDHDRYIEPEPQTIANIYSNGKFDVELNMYSNSRFDEVVSPLPAVVSSEHAWLCLNYNNNNNKEYVFVKRTVHKKTCSNALMCDSVIYV